MEILKVIGLVVCCLFLVYFLVITNISDIVVDSDSRVRDLVRYLKRIKPLEYATGTLTFKQMLSFYNVRPAAWSFNTQYDIVRAKYTTDDCETFIFNFTTYGEQYKFKRWVKYRQKHLADLYQAERMSEFISHVRDDARNSAYSAQEEAQKIYDRICSTLNFDGGQDR